MKMWLRLGVVLALGASVGWTVDWNARYPHPEGYVSDFANVIDSASRIRLEAYAASLAQSTGAQIALVTIPSLESEPIDDVARTLFRAWGVGEKDKNNGVMLMLSIGDHKSRLQVGYGLERVLPTDLDNDILTAMSPALRQGDFGEAMMGAAESIGNAIATAQNVHLQTQLPARRIRPSLLDRIPWAWILGAAVLALLVLVVRYLRRSHPYAPVSGGTGPVTADCTSSSGGFGGFDSHDSFGGFGGGDCGSGGASSSW